MYQLLTRESLFVLISAMGADHLQGVLSPDDFVKGLLLALQELNVPDDSAMDVFRTILGDEGLASKVASFQPLLFRVSEQDALDSFPEFKRVQAEREEAESRGQKAVIEGDSAVPNTSEQI